MSVFELAIGWLAPPLCINCGAEGAALCVSCSVAQIIPHGQRCFDCGVLSADSRTCPKCRRNGSPDHVWVTTNYEDTAKELVKLYKFGQQRAAAKDLAKMMSSTFLSRVKDAVKSDYLVVPIPTATHRVRERGFDHAVLLARAIATNLNFKFSRALSRQGQARQIGSTRSTRLSQSIGNYRVNRPTAIRGHNILLVDDVVTTGATLIAATSALKAAGVARVDALVFAKRL